MRERLTNRLLLIPATSSPIFLAVHNLITLPVKLFPFVLAVTLAMEYFLLHEEGVRHAVA